jgi:hypothetical protein
MCHVCWGRTRRRALQRQDGYNAVPTRVRPNDSSTVGDGRIPDRSAPILAWDDDITSLTATEGPVRPFVLDQHDRQILPAQRDGLAE